VIVSMQKVRILGPRSRLVPVLETLQDFGAVHLCRSALDAPLSPISLSAKHTRHVARVETALGDVEESLARLHCTSLPGPRPVATPVENLAREVRLARRARRAVTALAGESRALEDERERLVSLAGALEAFVAMGVSGSTRWTRSFFLVLSRDVGDSLERLRQALAETLGAAFALHTQALPDGELAVALVVSETEAERIESLLPEAGVRELEIPEARGAAGSAPAYCAPAWRSTTG
jgi:vacuolar-type H+-ATPase subunit I/STV1